MTTNIPFQSQVPEIADRNERILLAFIALFLLLGTASLGLLQPENPIIWLRLIGWLVCALGGNFLLRKYLANRDPILFPITMLLSGWGLLVIARLAPIFADRQTIWLILSAGVLLFTALTPYMIRWLRSFRYILLAIGLILLISTILLGQNPSGQPGAPQLWLGFGGIYFQPSEVLKLILVAFLASYLGEQYPVIRAEELASQSRSGWFSPRLLGPMVLMWGLSIMILVWQRDLGTAILFFVVFALLFYVATGYTRILFGGAGLVGIATIVAYQLFAVVRLRIDIWLNPWLEADGRAYQIVQSLMAFASGGVFGQGVGQGSPDYIPVVHSDFIFAALAEEWGLLGVITLLAGIAIIVMRGLRIAVLHQGHPFYALLSIGLSLLLGVQSLLIMGGVLKILPLTGVTLPFVSYGGSSLLISFVMVGLLLRLSAGKT